MLQVMFQFFKVELENEMSSEGIGKYSKLLIFSFEKCMMLFYNLIIIEV